MLPAFCDDAFGAGSAKGSVERGGKASQDFAFLCAFYIVVPRDPGVGIFSPLAAVTFGDTVDVPDVPQNAPACYLY